MCYKNEHLGEIVYSRSRSENVKDKPGNQVISKRQEALKNYLGNIKKKPQIPNLRGSHWSRNNPSVRKNYNKLKLIKKY